MSLETETLDTKIFRLDYSFTILLMKSKSTTLTFEIISQYREKS